MATFTAKVLGQGQVANAKSTVYTVPALTTAYIRFLSFYNTNAAVQTVNLYFNPNGTSRQVRTYTLNQYESAEFPDMATPILEAGGLIEADTTTAAAVDYFISGVEQT